MQNDENDAITSPSARKRIRLNPPLEELDRDEYRLEHGYDRISGIPDYFVNTQIRGEAFDSTNTNTSTSTSKDASRRVDEIVTQAQAGPSAWRRKRSRLGVGYRGGILGMATARCEFWSDMKV
jgi:hypothetical protein